MKSQKERDQEAAALLVEVIIGTGPTIFDNMVALQKDYVIVMTAAKMIERTLCEVGGYRCDDVLEGLDVVVRDMRRSICKRCEDRQ
jgi:hypothetical protein